MATVQVTEENFEETIKSGIVLLDFWAALVRPLPRVRSGLRGRGRAPSRRRVRQGRHRGRAGAGCGFRGPRDPDADGAARRRPARRAARGHARLGARRLVEKVRALDMDEVRRSIDAAAAAAAAPDPNAEKRLMCRRATCPRCGLATFAGCGAHVEQVLGARAAGGAVPVRRGAPGMTRQARRDEPLARLVFRPARKDVGNHGLVDRARRSPRRLDSSPVLDIARGSGIGT